MATTNRTRRGTVECVLRALSQRLCGAIPGRGRGTEGRECPRQTDTTVFSDAYITTLARYNDAPASIWSADGRKED